MNEFVYIDYAITSKNDFILEIKHRFTLTNIRMNKELQEIDKNIQRLLGLVHIIQKEGNVPTRNIFDVGISGRRQKRRGENLFVVRYN